MSKEGDIKYRRKFGEGTLLGDTGDRYFNQTLEPRVKAMAWSHACPVPDQVIKNFGIEWAEKRYAECNFIYTLVTDAASKHNLPLYFDLNQSLDRLPEENPSQNILSENVPSSFWTKMSPMSTPWGYAIPRVIVEQFGRGKNNFQRSQKRILSGLNLIETEVKRNNNPIELLIALAKGVSNLDAKAEPVITHIMSKDLLDEEGCKSIFKEISQVMERKAPKLWQKYQQMLDQKEWQGIIIRPEDLK